MTPDGVPPVDGTTGMLFALLLVGSAIAVRVRPIAGVALLILFDPFGLSRHLWHTDVTTTKAVVLGAAVGLAFRGGALHLLAATPVRWLLLAAGALVTANLLTAIPGEYIDVVAREVLKSVEYLAIFAVAAVAYRQDPDERIVWLSLLVCTISVSALALVQERSGAESVALVGSRVIPRIAGPLEGPNQLAGFFDVAIPVLLAVVLKRPNVATGLVVALAAVADVLTLSRAGFLGLGAGIAAVLARTRDARVRVAALLSAGSILIAAGLLAKQGALSRFLSVREVDTGTGLGTRTELWSAAVRFFLSHPVLGIGAGNFELELPTVGVLGVRTHANSLYLQSLAEGGAVLFLATICALVVPVVTLYFAKRSNAFVLGAGAATIALAAHQLFDDVTFFPKVGGFWWLWLGIAAGSAVAETQPKAAAAAAA